MFLYLIKQIRENIKKIEFLFKKKWILMNKGDTNPDIYSIMNNLVIIEFNLINR